MTHSELAKALKLARSTVTRDVAAGMPLDIRAAREWRAEHKNIVGEKTGPKTQEREHEENENEVRLPNWLRQEHRERLLSKQIQDLMWTSPRTVNRDNHLVTLRAKYELLAASVLDDHLELVEAALNRRFLSCGGFSPDEAPERYVDALSELVEKWQGILDTVGDKEQVEVRGCLN